MTNNFRCTDRRSDCCVLWPIHTQDSHTAAPSNAFLPPSLPRELKFRNFPGLLTPTLVHFATNNNTRTQLMALKWRPEVRPSHDLVYCMTIGKYLIFNSFVCIIKLTCLSGRRLAASMYSTFKQLNKMLTVYD